MAIQVGAISLAALRFPLWAKYPRNAEQLTFHFLIFAQLAASSLLFPLLFRSRTSTTMVVAVTWPLALLAAALASVQFDESVRPIAYVNAWLIGLALWRRALVPFPATLGAGVMIAGAWALGGPLLRYLSLEFGGGERKHLLGALDVIGAAYSLIIAAPSAPWTAWLAPLSLIGSALLMLLLVGARARWAKAASARPAAE